MSVAIMFTSQAKLSVSEHKGVIYQWQLHTGAVVAFTVKAADILFPAKP